MESAVYLLFFIYGELAFVSNPVDDIETCNEVASILNQGPTVEILQTSYHCGEFYNKPQIEIKQIVINCCTVEDPEHKHIVRFGEEKDFVQKESE